MQLHNVGPRCFSLGAGEDPRDTISRHADDPYLVPEYFPPPHWLVPGLHFALLRHSAIYRALTGLRLRSKRLHDDLKTFAFAEDLSLREAQALLEEADARGVPVLFFSLPCDGPAPPSGDAASGRLPADRVTSLYVPGRGPEYYEIHPPPNGLDQFAERLVEVPPPPPGREALTAPMALPDRNDRHRPARPRLIRILAVLITVAAMELLLRLAVGAWARWSPLGCGTRPEFLGRLLFAHAGGSPAPNGKEAMTPDPHRGLRSASVQRRSGSGRGEASAHVRGTRGEREYAIPKPPSMLRIVALGDSQTYGYGVDGDATWPAQLERALDGVEVVNLGEPAYAHDQMYFALKDDGLPLEPDAVVLGFFDPDLLRDELTFYCYDKPRFSPSPEGWTIENLPVASQEEVRRRFARLPLVYAVPRALFEWLTMPRLGPHAGEERGTEILRRTRALAEGAGARFILVNLPSQLAGSVAPTPFFKDYCERTGTECVDPTPVIVAALGTDSAASFHERFHRSNDIHYSREGYALIAEALRRHFLAHPIARASSTTTDRHAAPSP